MCYCVKELTAIKKINPVKFFTAGKNCKPAVPTVNTNTVKSNVSRR